jgi:hypothetical protein
MDLLFCKKCGQVFSVDEKDYLVRHEKDCSGKQWCPQHGYPLPCYKCGLESFVPGSVRFGE